MGTLTTIPDYKFRAFPAALCIAFFLICTRLIYLQIIHGTLFLNKSTKNFLRFETINSRRGNILDAHGKQLATNRPIHNVCWRGSGKYYLTKKQKKTIKHLEAIIDKQLLNDPILLKKIEQAERYYKTTQIATDIPFEQLSQIEEIFSAGHNILIDTSFKRFYPYTSYASHILGYLGRMELDLTGKMGLERLFEQTLKGRHGAMISTINSFGRRLTRMPMEQALAGTDIQTTLDLDLQTIIENVFPDYLTGTCIVMDTQNGDIVAITSRPNFDPTIFLNPILQEEWNKMQYDHPFLNRAFNANYPPGSIFKLVVTSAALEHGIITPDTIWNCKGYITFSGRRYHCHVQKGHGKLTVSQALEQSCNPLFYDIGTKMSINTFADYAHRFGLGEETKIIFPEKKGLIPTESWKEKTKGEKWWPGETLSASVGQSFLLVTPIQVARMIASIFSGYLITPRLLASEPVVKVPLNIQPETLEFLRQSMKKVVTQGTGKRISRIKDIEVYAKTSTAQTSALNKRNKGRIYKEHGWFVAQFRYKNNRPLTIVVLVEHAGTSRTPTIIAKRFLVKYKQLADRQIV